MLTRFKVVLRRTRDSKSESTGDGDGSARSSSPSIGKLKPYFVLEATNMTTKEFKKRILTFNQLLKLNKPSLTAAAHRCAHFVHYYRYCGVC